MDASSVQIAEQAHKYTASIGKGIQSEQLADIVGHLDGLKRRDWFAKHQNVPFWYERFDGEGLTPKLSVLADAWVEASI